MTCFSVLVPERQTPADQSHYPMLFLCADLTRAERALQTGLTVCTGSPAPVLSRDCMVSTGQQKTFPQGLFNENLNFNQFLIFLPWCKQKKYGKYFEIENIIIIALRLFIAVLLLFLQDFFYCKRQSPVESLHQSLSIHCLPYVFCQQTRKE